MDIVIRKTRDDELKTIQDLNYQLFVHDKIYDPLIDMKWPYETEGTNYFKSRIKGENGVCFVAEIDSVIVGYLAGGIAKPYSYRRIKTEAELENTLVVEEYRHRGIGEKLFNEFMNWCKAKGAEIIKVNASTDNLNAISFYKKVGFKAYSSELEYVVIKSQSF